MFHRGFLYAAIIFAALMAWPSVSQAAGVGEKCNTVGGIPCDAGLWCKVPAGRCAVLDAGGICARVPDVCNQAILPVCGCDGKTYNNQCEMDKHRVSKNHDGKC
jgi:hypothetical protein